MPSPPTAAMRRHSAGEIKDIVTERRSCGNSISLGPCPQHPTDTPNCGYAHARPGDRRGKSGPAGSRPSHSHEMKDTVRTQPSGRNGAGGPD